MEGSQEDQSEVVVEGGALLEAGFGLVEGRLGCRDRPAELVPCFSAERVEDEEERHVRDILSEVVVLRIAIVL